MREKVDILGIKISKVNMKQAVSIVSRLIENTRSAQLVVTPNSEIIVMAQQDRELAWILNQAALSVPDGAGVVMASRLLGNPVPERVAGFDLMQKLFAEGEVKGYSFYLLGGRPEVVKEARDKLLQKYPALNILGFHHGYLDEKLQEKLIQEINQLQPDVLLVGMGVPRQEKFIAANLARLKVKVALTVGGAFDVLAGRVQRAPLWMQRSNLEWLFRLLQEPQRFWRILALPKFIYLVVKKRVRR